jgi:hypothetical protein
VFKMYSTVWPGRADTGKLMPQPTTGSVRQQRLVGSRHLFVLDPDGVKQKERALSPSPVNPVRIVGSCPQTPAFLPENPLCQIDLFLGQARHFHAT